MFNFWSLIGFTGMFAVMGFIEDGGGAPEEGAAPEGGGTPEVIPAEGAQPAAGNGKQSAQPATEADRLPVFLTLFSDKCRQHQFARHVAAKGEQYPINALHAMVKGSCRGKM